MRKGDRILCAPAPSALGQPLTPAPASPPPIVVTGQIQPESEGNNNRAEATPIDLGDSAQGTVAQHRDHDFYRFTTPHPGELTVNFARVPAGLNMAFRVLNETGAQVWGWQSAPANGETFIAWADLRHTGIYFIEIADGSDDARSAEPYHFFAALDPTADPAESNDNRADATPLAPGTSISAAILPRGDADFYRLVLARAGRLDVTFDQMPTGLNVSFRVLNETGAQVWGWKSPPANGAPFTGTAEVKAPGVYFLELRDGSNDARSVDAYRFAVTFH